MGKVNTSNVKVYHLATELSDELWEFVSGWNAFEKQTIGEEIVRSVDKVGSSLAVGLGRGNVNDHTKLIKVSRGYLNETMYWLNRAHSRNLIDLNKMLYLKSKLEVLVSKLNSYSKTFDVQYPHPEA